ncbi:MAG: helix-turn-helix transcriptional regulator [Tissierellia bacterium]|nr:helix-turn-helix transcriptional regulator [Tissierellia bacterium]
MRNIRMIEMRKQRQLSQEQLGQIVGATRQTIGLIESGDYNPTLRLCIAISKALDCTLNDLFWRVEDEE